MSLTVTWSVRCKADIRRMHYIIAERVCGAIVAFARDGSGDIVQVPGDPEGSGMVRLRAPGGFALVRVVAIRNELRVYKLSQSDPLRLVTPLLDADEDHEPEPEAANDDTTSTRDAPP